MTKPGNVLASLQMTIQTHYHPFLAIKYQTNATTMNGAMHK